MTRSQRSHDPFTPLRALSCVSVMLAHTVSDLSVVFSGTMAVAFFLALSGYLITKNVMGQIEPQFDEAPKFFGGRLLLKYMIRRFFRLYPCFIVVAYIHSHELFGGCPLIDVLLLKVPFEHLWTMKVEILVSFKHVPIYFTLYSMLMIGMAKVLPKPFYKGFKVLYHAFVCSLPFVFTHYRKDICDLLDSYDSLWVQRNIFFYGVAGGIISHYMKICKLTPKLDTPLKKGILAAIAYALLYGIYLTNPGTQWNLFRIGGGWPDGTIWWRALLPYVVVYAAFINCMEYMPETSYIMQFLNLKYIQLIGKASYSLYLIHKIPITLLKKYTNVINTDLFVYDFVGSLILGAILYNLVEYPCIILSQKAVVLSEKLLDQSKEYIVKKTGNWSSVQLSDEEVQSISTP